eukprot:3742734-Prymnesium_polylepis.1
MAAPAPAPAAAARSCARAVHPLQSWWHNIHAQKVSLGSGITTRRRHPHMPVGGRAYCLLPLRSDDFATRP